jgi:hypothetical protein
VLVVVHTHLSVPPLVVIVLPCIYYPAIYLIYIPLSVMQKIFIDLIHGEIVILSLQFHVTVVDLTKLSDRTYLRFPTIVFLTMSENW